MDELLKSAMGDLDARHLHRRRRPVHIIDSTHIELDGKACTSFSSNDYLGLSHHRSVLAAVKQSIEECGWGSGAAPLISGFTDRHAQAERTIAKWKGCEDAVLLPSGYQANHAAIGTIAAVAGAQGKAVRFLTDKLVHASMIDAIRATGAVLRVFPHNHIAKLSRLLVESPADEIQVVVTESVFSMDGDFADLAAMAQLKRERPFVLVVDEAHATGLYGPQGSGYAAQMNVSQEVDLSIVTLSKALGGVGGSVCGSSSWCEAVVNFARAYLFSTSVPAAVAAGAVAAIDVCREEPHRRERTKKLARRIRDELEFPGTDSPIIPIVLGDETQAVVAAERLREVGFLVPAIRPPTVPRGSSRLRVTVSCEHTDDEVDRLIRILKSTILESLG